MTGYDEANAYVCDNSKTEVQPIPIAELELAWAEDYIGMSKKNAEVYLSSPLNFMGQRGLDRFIAEFSDWADKFTKEELQKIYLHFIE